MKTFKRRTQEVSAVRFEYTEKGMQELRDFCNGVCKNVRFTKERHPHSIAQAHIYDLGASNFFLSPIPHTLWENHWLTKTPQGALVSYTDKAFKELYEE